MKKLLMTLLIIALSSCALADDMTPDELIANYFEAIGGEKAIRGVEDIFLKGSMLFQGAPLVMKMWVKPPDKSFVEVSMNNMVVGGGGSNGSEAWSVVMGQVQQLDGDQARMQAKKADMFPLLDYEKHGHQVNYLGETTVNDKSVHKLEFVDSDSDSTYWLFDARTFHLIQRENSVEKTTFEDRRKVGGIMWPYKMTIDGQQGQVQITYDSVAVNTGIPDSIFVLPADAKPMPKMPGAPSGSGN